MLRNNWFKAALATAAALSLFLVLMAGLAFADPDAGTRTPVEFPVGGLSWETTIPAGYELAVTEVVTAPTAITVSLTANQSYSYTVGGAPWTFAWSSGGPFEATIPLVPPWDADIGVRGADVTAELVPNGPAKFTVSIMPSAPKPTPTPTATPTPVPTVVVGSAATVDEVDVAAGKTVVLGPFYDGTVFKLESSGPVTATVRSGAVFGVNDLLRREKGLDGLYFLDISTWVAGPPAELQATRDGQKFWVYFTATADVTVKYSVIPPKPATAPAAAVAALPPTGGGSQVPGLWDRVAAFLGRLIWR